jgi:hypothetical protein
VLTNKQIESAIEDYACVDYLYLTDGTRYTCVATEYRWFAEDNKVVIYEGVGFSRCGGDDKFDTKKGFDIAYSRAIRKIRKKIMADVTNRDAILKQFEKELMKVDS